jgi:hypothetical protein
MGKRLRKSEKLDLILSELAKLRREVKKLASDRLAVAHQGVKAKLRSSAGWPKKLPKPIGAGTKTGKDVTPSKSVLVQPPQVPQPTGRTAPQ